MFRDNCNKKRVDSIVSSCFWDYNFNENEILDLAHSKNEANRRFLFGKIIENSDNLLDDLKIFAKENLIKLISSYEVPSFNHHFINKRYLIVKNYFLKEKVFIPELSWEK